MTTAHVRAFVVDLSACAALGALMPQGGAPAVGALGALTAVLVARALRAREGGGIRGPTFRAASLALALTPALIPLATDLPASTAPTLALCALIARQALLAEDARDERRLLLLSLLLLLLGCTRPPTSPFLLALACDILLLPWGLMLCAAGIETGNEAAPDARASLTATLGFLLLGLFFFLALPRPDMLALPGEGHPGVASEMDLDAPAPWIEGDAVVLRARPRDPRGRPIRGDLYFRGRAFDRFDGERWTASREGLRPNETSAPPPALTEDLVVTEVLLEPTRDGTLFGIPEILFVRGLEGLASKDADDGWSVTGEPRRLRYETLSRPLDGLRQAPRPSLDPGPRYLELPATLDPRVAALALSLAPMDESPRERLLVLNRYLRETHAWSDDPSLPGTLADLLFGSRAGSCESFATAQALMARALGLPARLVTGFHGGTWDARGELLTFRARDAHAWAEIRVEGSSWETWDATPPAGLPRSTTEEESSLSDALARLVGWDGRAQRAILERAVSILASPRLLAPLLAVTALLLGLTIILMVRARWKTRRKRAEGRVHARWLEARRLTARKGWHLPERYAPMEAARWLRERAGPEADALLELVELHYRVRYGGNADAAHAPEASRLLARLRNLPGPPPASLPAHGRGAPAWTPPSTRDRLP